MFYGSGARISCEAKTIRRAVDYENSGDAHVKSTEAIIVTTSYNVVNTGVMGVARAAGIIVEH